MSGKRIRNKAEKRKAKRGETVKFRRVATLVVYWQQNQLVLENYAQQSKITAEPLTCAILDYCWEWRTLREICRFLEKYSEPSVARSLKELCVKGVLERSDQKPGARVKAMRHLYGREQIDVGRQLVVQAQRVGRQVCGDVEVRHLSERVHAGVGAARAVDANLFEHGSGQMECAHEFL